VIEESQGIVLAKSLSRHGARVVAHDPLAGAMAAHELKDPGLVLQALPDCLDQASVVVITTPDPVYCALEAADFTAGGRPVTVVDCWRTLSAKLSSHPGIRYVPIGRSVDDARNASRLAALWAAH
jgi:UDP-glucose 6-dehydrogenase